MIKKFFTKGRKTAIPNLDRSQKCIGYLDQTQRFQFTTFEVDPDKERIMQELQSAGFSIVEVMDVNRARKLATIDSSFSDYPKSSRF